MKKIRIIIPLMLVSFILFPFEMKSQTSNDSTKRSVFDQEFQKGNSKMIKLLVFIEHGQFKIQGTYKKLARIHFDYLKKYWSPSASYLEEDGFGKLVIKANAASTTVDNKQPNICNIELNNNFEYQLGIELGAGLADINLNGYNIKKALFRLGAGKFDINLANTPLQSLKLDAGAGEVNLDLSGKRNQNLKGEIKGGVGQITIVVPANTSCEIRVRGILGSVEAKGFRKSGNIYGNNVTEGQEPLILIDLAGGIGNVVIEQR
jgi:hypothetical protein